MRALVSGAREAIAAGDFETYRTSILDGASPFPSWRGVSPGVRGPRTDPVWPARRPPYPGAQPRAYSQMFGKGTEISETLWVSGSITSVIFG